MLSGELPLLIPGQIFLALEPIVLLFDSLLLRVDDPLLFADCVDQHDVKLVVLDAFDLAVFVVCDQQWFDLCHLFGDQTEVVFAGGFPVEGDGAQTLQ